LTGKWGCGTAILQKWRKLRKGEGTVVVTYRSPIPETGTLSKRRLSDSKPYGTGK
jgi:hypothetical protein